MSRKLPNKTSSRAGRFKKKLVSAEVLLIEAPLISAKIAPLLDLFSQQRISAAEFTALYVLVYLSIRNPGNWLGARAPEMPIKHEMNVAWDLVDLGFEPNIKRRLAGITNLGEIFKNFALKSTPLTVNRALLSWSNGSYPLELMFRIPKPAEVLLQQKQGHRCVTVLHEQNQLDHYILGERDGLSFTMHDLIHADHFYHHNDCFQGQLSLYGFLDFCMREKHFEKHLQDKGFEREFEYIISDMNAYAIHAMKCLKSAIKHYDAKDSCFFSDWVKQLNPADSEQAALMNLNTADYHPEIQDHLILQFLNKWRVL